MYLPNPVDINSTSNLLTLFLPRPSTLMRCIAVMLETTACKTAILDQKKML